MTSFFKVHGIGNDFVLIDGIAQDLSQVDFPEFATQICDRKFGVGSDGLLILERGTSAPFRMVMFNPDGSESEMCGNGIRCLARKIWDLGYTDNPLIQCETGAGVLELESVDDCLVRVDLGPISFEPGKIGIANRSLPFIDDEIVVDGETWRGTAVSVGNPHIVFFLEDVAEYDLPAFGSKVENHPFFPNRINVHIVQVESRNRMIQRTWERGAGLTLACGTGACAVTAAAWKTGRTGPAATVVLPGGELQIEINEASHAIMTGPAETVFAGNWLATLPIV